MRLTWDRLCPLDCGDHLATAQHVERGEDPPAGVGQGAVVARVEHLGLDDLEQGHQGGRQLRQRRGHDALVGGRLRRLARARRAALLQPLDLLLGLAGCEGWGENGNEINEEINAAEGRLLSSRQRWQQGSESCTAFVGKVGSFAFIPSKTPVKIRVYILIKVTFMPIYASKCSVMSAGTLQGRP